MKVFLVWSGAYSDRSVVDVYSTMAAAEYYVADSHHPTDYDIEEFEVRDSPPKWLTIHEAVWNTLLGERVSQFRATDDFLGVEEAEDNKHRPFYGVTVRAATRSEAVKQMQALRDAWLKQKGLTEVPKPDHPMPTAWYKGMVEIYGA